jgi:hypothetical protein
MARDAPPEDSFGSQSEGYGPQGELPLTCSAVSPPAVATAIDQSRVGTPATQFSATYHVRARENSVLDYLFA